MTTSLHRALEHHQAGRLAEAEAIYRQVLAADPHNADALHLLGLIAQQVGRHDDAITLLQRATVLNPQRAETFAALGASLGVSGRVNDAQQALMRAAQLNPGLADAQLNLGNTFDAAGQLEQAIACYDSALRTRPTDDIAHAAHGNRGRALLALGRPKEAIADLSAAVRLRPSDAGNHFRLGVALERAGLRDDAAASYRQTIALDPTLAEAHFNLGVCVSADSDAREALAHYNEAIRLRPDDGVIPERVLHAHHYDENFDPRASFERHRNWAARFADPFAAAAAAPASHPPPHASRHDPYRRLRIGYVSPDFRRHSVSYFLEPLLAAHDKTQVEVFCYADERTRDQTTERLQGYADCWRSITDMSDQQLAQLVRDDRIDILIDLTGHVRHNRLLAFAAKPAPIQVSYLGYPDTTGMRAIDYRLTDALADPPGASDAFYTEQLIRLPDCGWCYRPDDQAPPPDRDGNADGITFGCFNIAAKINAALIAAWSAILRAVPNSGLIIKDGQGTPSPAIPRLRLEFERQNIPADRVEMLSYLPDFAAHFGLYRRVDIALDTFPYNGTTTTCEALWMGVPVITMAGAHHMSRVGCSLLTAVGRPDLIAHSADDYIGLATRLAGQGKLSTQQRRDLREQMRRSPLLDADRFARKVEAAYRQMWIRYARG